MDYSQILKDYNDVLLPGDIQKILKLGRNTVYGYLDKGIIKSIRIGRKYLIPKQYLINFMYPDLKYEENDNSKEEGSANGTT